MLFRVFVVAAMAAAVLPLSAQGTAAQTDLAMVLGLVLPVRNPVIQSQHSAQE